MPVTFNDQELRKLLRSVPGKAMKLLYAEYYNSLVRIAFSLTHDNEVSEEIVQDTLVHVWLNAQKLCQYHERSIEHYLVKVVRNKAISYYKENLYINKQMIKFLNGRPYDPSVDSPEAHMIHLEMSKEIRDLIAKFPRREYECLAMRIDEELDNHEISARLKVSVKEVQRAITSAKKRLRRHLDSKR
jgi:RNA polymerase sigma factor (sigma-70 family)